MKFDAITEKVIGFAIDVHRELGPGLLESAYEACLEYEIRKARIDVLRQHPVQVVYKEISIECGYRIDLLVGDSVVVELKSVESLLPIHEAQLLTYMKLSKKSIGLLLNFNVPLLKDGIKRMVL